MFHSSVKIYNKIFVSKTLSDTLFTKPREPKRYVFYKIKSLTNTNPYNHKKTVRILLNKNNK